MTEFLHYKFKPAKRIGKYFSFIILAIFILPFFLTAQENINNFSDGWYWQKCEQSKINLRDPHGIFFDSNGLLWITSQSGITSFDGTDYRFFNNLHSKELIDNRFSGNIGYLIHGTSGNFYKIDQTLMVPKRVKNPIYSFKNVVYWNSNEYKKEISYLKKKIGPALTFRLLKNKNNLFYKVKNGNDYLVLNDFLFQVINKELYPISKLPLDRLSVFTFGKHLVENHENNFTFYYNGKAIHSKDFLRNFLDLKESEKDRIFKTPSGHIVLLNNNCFYFLKNTKLGLKKDLIKSNINLINIKSIDYYEKQNVIAIAVQNIGVLLLKKKQINKLNCNIAVYGIYPYDNNRIITGNGLVADLNSRKVFQGIDQKTQAFCFLKESKSKFWTQSDPCYIRCYNRNLQLIEQIELNTGQDYHGYIHTLIKDHEGNKWYHTDGSIYFESKDKSLKKSIFRKLSYIKLLPNELIETLHFKKSDILWIGTNNRLLEINLRTKKTQTLLVGVDLRCINKDEEGDYWLGTYGQGAFHYKNGIFRRLTLDVNKSLISCHAFILDKSGVIWITSDNGLFAIRKSTWLNEKNISLIMNSFIHYVKLDDGFIAEFNGGANPCALKLNNTIVLSSMDGIVYFDPKNITNDISRPNLLIYSIESDKTEFHNFKNINLPHEFRSLQIKFLLPNWKNESNFAISYSIQKEKEQTFWRYLEDKKTINIASLPSGNHKLIIRIQTRVGQQNTYYKTVNIHVDKSFFETIPFYIICTILFFLLIVLINKQRQKFLIRERNSLKKQLDKQFLELHQANAKLEMILADLKETNLKLEKSDSLKARIMSIFVHDLKSPMRFLALVSRHIFNTKKQLDENEIKELAENIFVTSHTSLQRIDQFLMWQSNEQNELNLNITRFPVSKSLEDLNQAFTIFSGMNKNEFTIEGDLNLLVVADIEILKIVLWNVIDNANKYTQKGSIKVIVRKTNNNVEIKVIDTGIGMNNESLEIARVSLQKNDLGKIHKNLGLKIIGDFIRILKGTVEITSEGINEGTSVVITIPSAEP